MAAKTKPAALPPQPTFRAPAAPAASGTRGQGRPSVRQQAQPARPAPAPQRQAPAPARPPRIQPATAAPATAARPQPAVQVRRAPAARRTQRATQGTAAPQVVIQTAAGQTPPTRRRTTRRTTRATAAAQVPPTRVAQARAWLDQNWITVLIVILAITLVIGLVRNRENVAHNGKSLWNWLLNVKPTAQQDVDTKKGYERIPLVSTNNPAVTPASPEPDKLLVTPSTNLIKEGTSPIILEKQSTGGQQAIIQIGKGSSNNAAIYQLKDSCFHPGGTSSPTTIIVTSAPPTIVMQAPARLEKVWPRDFEPSRCVEIPTKSCTKVGDCEKIIFTVEAGEDVIFIVPPGWTSDTFIKASPLSYEISVGEKNISREVRKNYPGHITIRVRNIDKNGESIDVPIVSIKDREVPSFDDAHRR